MPTGVMSTTTTASKSWNAARVPSHYALTTGQEIPDWNTARLITSR
jgi:hypothetical protein